MTHSFPIDIVYSWVDGNDPKHQKLWHEITKKEPDYQRFFTNSELYYSLYSVYKFAPWVRKIFIVVADYQRPPLEGLPQALTNKIVIIPESLILPHTALPLFNSMAVETSLHNIPELAEHFIYFNDDMFLGNFVDPSDFFNVDGKGYCFVRRLSKMKSKFISPSNAWLIDFLQTIAVYQKLVLAEGKTSNFFFLDQILHQCYPCRKSILQYLSTHPQTQSVLTETMHSPIRAFNNVKMIFLMYLVGCSLEFLELKIVRSEKFISITERFATLYKLKRLYLKKPKLFCVNNELANPNPKIETAFQNFLKNYFC